MMLLSSTDRPIAQTLCLSLFFLVFSSSLLAGASVEHYRPMTATMVPWKPALDAGPHPQRPPFGDTTFTKIFVGGLAWETHSKALRRHYEPSGDILEAVVIYDKNTGRSKGYGFVTFLDPESARRACADPSPIIDGRRANCNLASLGRSQPVPPYDHLRPVAQYLGGTKDPQGTYVGSSIYRHEFLFGYQQPISYMPYGYTAYGSEYVPQNVYFPYTSQQHLQFYGVHGTVNTTGYPYGHIVQPIAGGHGYTTVQGYNLTSHQLVQLTGPHLFSGATGSVPALQLSYSAGATSAFPSHTQLLVSAHSPQFAQGSGPEPTAG